MKKLWTTLAARFGPSDLKDIHVKEIDTLEELDEALASTRGKPAFIFKHSTRCPISSGANRRVRDYILDKQDAEADIPEFYLLKVVESRAVSDALAEQLGVPHQSPQLILVRDGKAVWSTTHHNIAADAIDKALEETAA